MAAPSKQSSRWGSFLSQAVAGVEARLDNILAESEGDSAPQPKDNKTASPSTATPPASAPTPVKQSPGMLRVASSSAGYSLTTNCLQVPLELPQRLHAAPIASRRDLRELLLPRQPARKPTLQHPGHPCRITGVRVRASMRRAAPRSRVWTDRTRQRPSLPRRLHHRGTLKMLPERLKMSRGALHLERICLATRLNR
jgi:hypothetical protein